MKPLPLHTKCAMCAFVCHLGMASSESQNNSIVERNNGNIIKNTRATHGNIFDLNGRNARNNRVVQESFDSCVF